MSYKVPFVDLPTHYRRMKKEIDSAIEKVLSNGDLILRDDLRQFEKEIAAYLGVDYAVGLNSGTDALYLSLRAAGIGPGDEVITVAHTCMSTMAVINHCGAKIVLVDVGDDYNMDVSQVENAITPSTKAIIPVHLNGRLCDMERLMDIAARHNLMVIEDAAQAMGGTFDGKKSGTFGIIGCFSLYPMKILGAAGDGGFAVTNDANLADTLFLLRDLGQHRDTGEVAFFGFNSRLDNLQAAILNVKLKYLPQWIERRRELAGIYHRGLSDLPYLKLPPPPQSEGPFFDVYQNYVIRAQDRDRLVTHLNKCGIEVLTSWYLSKPLHHHATLGLSHFHLPQTEQFAKEEISLPHNTEISDEQVEYVIESIRNFYS